MANTLNILERTLAQIADSTNDLHTLGTANGRLSVYEPLVVRATDHADNDGAETGSDTEKMALFLSRRHGEPFEKKDNVQVHKVVKGTAGTGLTVDTTVVGGAITAVAINAAGTGYAKGDYVTVATGTGAQLLITEVAAGVVTGVAVVAGGTGYTALTAQATSLTVPTDVSVLFPNFDYSTFE